MGISTLLAGSLALLGAAAMTAGCGEDSSGAENGGEYEGVPDTPQEAARRLLPGMRRALPQVRGLTFSCESTGSASFECVDSAENAEPIRTVSQFQQQRHYRAVWSS